jgi:hypothetical protein
MEEPHSVDEKRTFHFYYIAKSDPNHLRRRQFGIKTPIGMPCYE